MVGDLGPWQLVDRHHRISAFANQGLATVQRPDGRRALVRRGLLSNPYQFRWPRRWVHIGDPGAALGYLVDCYQGHPGADEKMFRIRRPDGGHQEHVHPLVAGELYNSGFVALSPDGRWMVAGEWGLVSRLLVFPTPVLNPAAGTPADPLPLTGVIELDVPVNRPQGITFVGPTALYCSADDPTPGPWPAPRQVLRIELAAPLAGDAKVDGVVTFVGGLPAHPVLTLDPEVEGIDYDPVTGDLRVAIVRPGRVITTVYRYRQI